ncbi:hypothetical protein CRUP_009992 [Coryphaenoides rupestris]|nr:hypothetical protein CRUP_009992 [Coryphaenoides rupestris]
MKAAESRQSPAMVDIWFLKVSLVCSQRSRSAERLLSRAVLRFTLGNGNEDQEGEEEEEKSMNTRHTAATLQLGMGALTAMLLHYIA